ncbi:hypothetical protein GGS26DRAFT_585918 [Hypomontagnella submonticulosa]|nr:hypothetical protein GGS26DRAFT_585918 [Hypomontagnella submonticulosa]
MKTSFVATLALLAVPIVARAVPASNGNTMGNVERRSCAHDGEEFGAEQTCLNECGGKCDKRYTGGGRGIPGTPYWACVC